ncbi:MAG: tRNA pseudouridine(13) synthase TruD, partial [Candidatus Bathyarchaeota archaeon]
MSVPMLERELGMEVYASSASGIGGKIREFPEDFAVEEVLADGSKALISQGEDQTLTGGGRYLICVLVKRNWDTFLAVREVAKRLGIPSKRVQIAGIKDAHAVTAQHISIAHVGPKHVQQIRIRGIDLRPIRFSETPVFSRLLLGNRFNIRIGAISLEPSTIDQQIKKVEVELSSLGGAPNFFGHQRFGTIRPITHLVGRSIAQGDWKRAAIIYLAQSSPHELGESREARQQLQNSRNFRQALRDFPH